MICPLWELTTKSKLFKLNSYDIKFPDGGIITFNFCKNTENLCNNQSILIKYTKGEDCLPLSSTANVSNYWNLISNNFNLIKMNQTAIQESQSSSVKVEDYVILLIIIQLECFLIVIST